MNLNQITVPVTDVEKSILFYEQFGLQLIVKALPHYARFACTGDATFSLHKVEHPPPSEGIWLYFEVEDVDSCVNNLRHKGFLFEEPPTDKPWLWREARLRDPDGNSLIIYHAGSNRKNPPWRM